VLDGNRWFDETFVYAKRPGQPEHRWSNIRAALRKRPLDAVLLLTNSLRTGWMAWQTGARERVGYAGNWRDRLLTTRLYEPRRNGHKAGLPPIDSYLNLAYVLGAEWQPPRMELETTVADELAADAAWNQLSLPAGERVAVLNSGGAFGGAKHWPAEHFGVLARRLVDERGLSVLVNCGPAERDIARTIVTTADNPRVVSLADIDDLPIGLTKACIRRAALLVTTDSGPRFFGIAFGRPVVTLFGPTDLHTTRTHYARETCLSLDLDCQPCWERTCPLVHHRCMRDLSVDMVFDAAARLLESPQIDHWAA
jgi:heptosyltransferase-2